MRVTPATAMGRKERITVLVQGLPSPVNCSELMMLFGRANPTGYNPVAKVELVSMYPDARGTSASPSQPH
jgi:hypothetical protein